VFDFSDLPMIDDHSHPYLINRGNLSASNRYEPLDTFLRQPGLHPAAVAHRDAMIYQRWAIRQLAEFLGCDAAPEAVARARAAEAGERDYVMRLFADGGLEALVCDLGYPQPPIGLSAFQAVTPIPVWPLYRIEPAIKSLLTEQVSYDEFLRRFDAGVRGAVLTDGAVGLKSIIAYRTGLDINLGHRSEEAGRRGLEQALVESDSLPASKALRDHLLLRTLELAIELQVPLQIHTGFGDIDVVLARCNPVGLVDALKDPVYRETEVVLVHCYPFITEASYLAATLPNVWCDLSAGIPFAPMAADRILTAALELAPSTRLLAGSDAFSGPEQSWLGAKITRQALARVLTDAHGKGFVTESEAPEIAAAILAGNARALYRRAEA